MNKDTVSSVSISSLDLLSALVWVISEPFRRAVFRSYFGIEASLWIPRPLSRIFLVTFDLAPQFTMLFITGFDAIFPIKSVLVINLSLNLVSPLA